MAKGKFHDWLTRDGLLQIEGWARLGLTDEQISKNIGISRSTFNEWKRKYTDISDSLKKGRGPLVFEIENALVKKALGYVDTESIVTEEKMVDGQIVELKKTVKRKYPPDTGSAIFLLKNKRPDLFQDKPKTTADKRAVELENTIRELKAQLLQNELQNENPEISKVDELLAKLDMEAGLGADDVE